jgi:uncharacterized membrane protein
MSKSRLETFSDGVFAIVITILVLELSFPIKNSLDSLLVFKSIIAMLPQLFLFFFSFITLSVMWINHHKILSNVDTINKSIVWYNSILLMFISLVPFATAILGANPQNKSALMIYSFLMIICSMCFSKLYRVSHIGVGEGEITKKTKVKRVKNIANKIYYIFRISKFRKMRHVGLYSYTASFFLTPFSLVLGYIFLIIPLSVYLLKKD